MKFAIVVGNLVASQKAKGLEGVKFLIVQPLDINRQPDGESYVAVDATQQAGVGELVFVVASKEAAFALPVQFVPVDAAVVGIVDDVDDRPLYDADSVAWKVFLGEAIHRKDAKKKQEKKGKQ
ncbi:MAG: EutN/CcmL family microcompartment protein [Anaerolineae bacterium]|nr:EutN/CcmL family microcompartment protein [Anaerolineae bacterium]